MREQNVDKQQVVDAMVSYFVNVLEPKHEAFGGMPPCPFVHKERVSGKIRYELCQIESGQLRTEDLSLIEEFSIEEDPATLLLIDPHTTISVEDGVALGIKLCERFHEQDIVSIFLHPNDGFEVDGYRPRCIPFATILVQTGRSIASAKQRLMATSYYSKWSRSDLEFNFRQFGRFLPEIDQE